MTAPDPAVVCRLAINLARNCGFACFPCSENKTPARPKREGGKGFEDASTDPDEIAWLWANWPGQLIGVRTGPASNLDVLDVDKKHLQALLWWQANYRRLLPTRCFFTRSGGLHLHYLHRHGIKNTQSKVCTGIDTRGEGGYAIHWFAAGFECIDHTPPQPFPDWLFHELTYRPPAPPSPPPRNINPDRAIEGVLRKFADTPEGDRNGMAFWCACRLSEHGLRQAEVENLLLPVAQSIGLTTHNDVREVRNTIRSAMGRSAAA